MIYREIRLPVARFGKGGIISGVKVYECLRCKALVQRTPQATQEHSDWHLEVEKK